MKASELFSPDTAQPAIDPETQKQLAGLAAPTAPPLIPEAFALERGQTTTDPLEPRTATGSTGAKKPLHKTVFTLVATGTGLGAVAGLAFGVFPQTVAQKPRQSSAPDKASPPIVKDEAAALRSQLAFQDQQQVIGAARPALPRSATVTAAKPTVAPPVSVPVPPSAPVLVSPRPAPAPVPVATRVEPPVDPFERWSALSTLGKQAATVESPTVSAATTAATATVATKPPPPAPFQTVQLGTPAPTPVASQRSESMPADDPPTSMPSAASNLTPGALGILKHAGMAPPETLVSDRDLASPRLTASANPAPALGAPAVVALGTSTAAKVTTPLVWDTSSGQADTTQTGRFQVALTEAMLASDGTIALPQGTRLLVQATTVSPDNQLVSASVLAVLYRGLDGGFRQETIPPGAILLQGKQGTPLVARKLNDPGAAIAQQDLLVGGLSALGKAGAVLNQPTTEVSNATSGGSFSSTTVQRSSQPKLLPALLDGFFNTTAQRLNQRSEQQTQELIKRNTLAIVPADTEVAVVINSFFRVNR